MKVRLLLISIFVGFIVVSFSNLGHADIALMKVYKEAYPDAKPKCISCHVSDKPKKDQDNELNGYGKKVMALAEKPTVEEFKKAGSIEDFEKNEK